MWMIGPSLQMTCGQIQVRATGIRQQVLWVTTDDSLGIEPWALFLDGKLGDVALGCGLCL